MASCPNVKYGIGTGGATEYNINSGREIFRCGDCVKAFITNVSLEKLDVSIICGDVSDANHGNFCMISASGSSRKRYMVNWTAKEGVTSTLENGSVITRKGAGCGGGIDKIYLYTDANINARVYSDIENAQTDVILETAKNKLVTWIPSFSSFSFILNDINANISPTDWQSLSVSGMAIGFNESNGNDIESANFNWNNGIGEQRKGDIVYDDTPTPQRLDTIIHHLMGI